MRTANLVQHDMLTVETARRCEACHCLGTLVKAWVLKAYLQEANFEK